ncbi:MAG: hypothetical protein RIR62_452 [Pseudomonadota bacterium]|jgi:opacity protein-like surface antigen
MRAAFLALPLLAACALPQPAPVPQAARLSATVLTVTLSDATVCRADWAASGGAGRLDGCGAGYDYRVTPVENPNILRQLVEGVFAALGAEGVSPPLATVVLTGADGRAFTFASPPPVE